MCLLFIMSNEGVLAVINLHCNNHKHTAEIILINL